MKRIMSPALNLRRLNKLILHPVQFLLNLGLQILKDLLVHEHPCVYKAHFVLHIFFCCVEILVAANDKPFT